MLIDKLSNDTETEILYFTYCKNLSEDTIHYRGRLTNIIDIIDSNNINDINKYKYVFIPELKYLDNVTLFPKTTVFLPLLIEYPYKYNKDYCFLTIIRDIEQYKPYYYIIIGNEMNEKTNSLLNEILISFFILGHLYFLFFSFIKCVFKDYFETCFYYSNYAPVILIYISIISIDSINNALSLYLIYTSYKSFSVTICSLIKTSTTSFQL